MRKARRGTIPVPLLTALLAPAGPVAAAWADAPEAALPAGVGRRTCLTATRARCRPSPAGRP
jgi:hypothetical protein